MKVIGARRGQATKGSGRVEPCPWHTWNLTHLENTSLIPRCKGMDHSSALPTALIPTFLPGPNTHIVSKYLLQASTLAQGMCWMDLISHSTWKSNMHSIKILRICLLRSHLERSMQL